MSRLWNTIENFRTAWSVGNIHGNSETVDIIYGIFAKIRSRILPAELEITSLICEWPNSDIISLNETLPHEPKFCVFSLPLQSMDGKLKSPKTHTLSYSWWAACRVLFMAVQKNSFSKDGVLQQRTRAVFLALLAWKSHTIISQSGSKSARRRDIISFLNAIKMPPPLLYPYDKQYIGQKIIHCSKY